MLVFRAPFPVILTGIQVRPVIGDSQDNGRGAGQRAHAWSVGASGGQHTLHLDQIQEGLTRLITCSTCSEDGVYMSKF